MAQTPPVTAVIDIWFDLCEHLLSAQRSLLRHTFAPAEHSAPAGMVVPRLYGPHAAEERARTP
jgi:hypothetical protein